MLTLFLSAALADTVTLDNGSVLVADLARYELDGDCQMTVTEGELQGAILIVPCHRVKAFDRTRPAAPVVLRAPTPDVVATAELPAGMPDSIAALRDDDFLTPFPVADAPVEDAPEAGEWDTDDDAVDPDAEEEPDLEAADEVEEAEEAEEAEGVAAPVAAPAPPPGGRHVEF